MYKGPFACKGAITQSNFLWNFTLTSNGVYKVQESFNCETEKQLLPKVETNSAFSNDCCNLSHNIFQIAL